jgi:predicted acylesterase/phospholipase RssA
MNIGVCISGGGAKIGFAVGVLREMEAHGIKLNLAYGVSSGSLCTAGICYGGLDFLEQTLLDIKERSDVLKKQWAKVIFTLVSKRGSADGWYEMNTMRRKLDGLPLANSKFRGVVGYVNLQSGQIEYKASDEVQREEFLDAVQASCSIPVYMQTKRAGNNNYVDGGVRDILPLKALIEDRIGVDEIHVILLSPVLMPSVDKPYKNIIEVGLRSIDLLVNEVLQNDYNQLVLVNKLIAQKQFLSSDLREWLKDKRTIRPYKYIPKKTICGTTDFCRENIEDGIKHGREVAVEELKNYQPS